MSENQWETAITKIKPNEIRLRGYRIDELMGAVSFSQAIYLTLMGEMPDKKIARLMDAILVSSIDHGATPPSALAARTAASTGAPLNAAVAAGILSINDFHGGAIHNCMLFLNEGLDLIKREGLDTHSAAITMVTKTKRISGFGHRVHNNDPRTPKLFALAEELGLGGNAVNFIITVKEVLGEEGKDLPINVDGAIAALLVDLKIPVEYANAFFIMARVPGIVAHVYEEKATQKPMRKIDPVNHVYNGPEDKNL